MARQAGKPAKIRIGKLSVGAIFEVTNLDGNTEWWKVIGRPNKSGKDPDGKVAYWVPCTHVLKDKNDPGVPAPQKSFNLKQEVILIRGGRKDLDAIDKRDQPGGVTSLDKLTDAPKELRDGFSSEDKDLEGLTDDEELSVEE